MRHQTLILTLSAGLWACGTSESPSDSGVDAGALDTGAPDAGDAGQFDSGRPEDAGPADTGADAGLSACAPALSLSPSSLDVLPLALHNFTASGGTGAYRFEVVDNQSGAIINNLSGAYLSGDISGVTDVVRVTDLGCVGEATATVTIVDAFSIRPNEVETPPGTSFDFEVVGGSGNVMFSFVQNQSGGTLSAVGEYAAGPSEGTDIIEARDSTGERAEATVDLVAGATVLPLPPLVFVGVGDTFELQTAGGSGHLELLQPNAFFSLTDGVMTGLSAGSIRADLVDRFTGQTTVLEARVVTPQDFPVERTGDGLAASTLLALGDVDEDGNQEVLLAHPEADLTAYNSGAVFIYREAGNGIAPSPVRTMSLDELGAEFGRSAATGDFNGDGLLDLAVGAPRGDSGATDAGKVLIYRGAAGAVFEAAPEQTLAGAFAADNFGWSLATCDFNADGNADLAVGAYAAEDRDRTPRSDGQGGVFIYLGDGDRFGNSPDLVLWGDLPDGNSGWTGQGNLRFGASLAAGDFDGDGACDLAVGTHEADLSGTNTGLVYVFKGGTPALADRPALGWQNDLPNDNGGELGRYLAAGDIDGDGDDELLASHRGFDAGNGDNHGAIRLFDIDTLPAAPLTALDSVNAASWSYVGNGSGDQVGWRPVVADATGDGVGDVLSGSLYDEVTGGPNSAGTVAVFAGRTGQLPDVQPSFVFGGQSGGDGFGSALCVLDDVDGDGTKDLVTLSVYAENDGRDVGRPDFVPGDGTTPPTALELPGMASGLRFGQGGDIVGDVNGDGLADLVVGAPTRGDLQLGLRSGGAYLYTGSATGFGESPALALRTFSGHSAGDQLGFAVSRAGDFDGDGVADFAVVSRYEDLPSSFNANLYADTASCTVARSNSGAVFVFRGSAAGLPSGEPMFVYFGPDAGQGIDHVRGGFDYNDDGRDDLLVASPQWDRPGGSNSGGFSIVPGRAADATGKIVVACDEALLMNGKAASDALGRSIAVVGDIDQDGCDDVAIGANGEDFAGSNEGSVRVVFGWGGAGCPANPEMIVLRSEVTNSQSGYSLAAGPDFDADGRPDLVTGGVGFAANNNTVGAAILVYGAYLDELPREPAQDATPPAAPQSMIDVTRPPGVVVGTTPGGRFGQSVEMLSVDGAAHLLAVGAPQGELGGAVLSGGVAMYLFQPGVGFVPQPIGAFGGEPSSPGGRLGEVMRAGRLGPLDVLFVGGYYGSSVGLDAGSVYVLPF